MHAIDRRGSGFSIPLALLCGGMAISAALLIAWRSHLTFFVDDWDLLLLRRGLSVDVLLEPHARHLIVGPVVLWKAIEATFGLDSQIPFAVAAIAMFMASVALLFVYLRRRVGDWLALAALLPLLFMGTAYEDLLNAFQICFFGSMAFGIGAVLAFEREDARRDVLSCLLLLASLAFAEIAFAFAAACAAMVALNRGPWRRLWVIAVPILVYIPWYLDWGQHGPGQLSFHHVANSPVYILDGFASSIASLLGLGTPTILLGNNQGALEWGRPLLLALLAGAVWGLLREPRGRSRPLIPLAAGLTFWFLVAANALLRPPVASRYQYVGAVFLLMIAADYAVGWRPDWRPGWRVLVPAFAVSAAATIANFSTLHDAYHAYRDTTAVIRGGLAGLEIAERTVDPRLVLNVQNSGFNYLGYVNAGSYLSAVGKFGSPAYSEPELERAPEGARAAADLTMGTALRLAVRPTMQPPALGRQAPLPLGPPGSATHGPCTTVRASAAGAPIVLLPAGGVFLRQPPGGSTRLSLRRFATASFPVDAGDLMGAGVLAIPADRSRRPWQLQLSATGPVTVCGIRTG